MSNWRSWYIILIVSLLACSDEKKKCQKKLYVACAASMQFVTHKLIEEFESMHNVDIDLISSSSGKITTQILNGAPYDIFISADMNYPQALIDKEKTIDKEVTRYGYGVPVIWTKNKQLNLDGISSVFHNSTIRKIAIADPKNAPYGRMAMKFLDDEYGQGVFKDKLVHGESISQINEYILNNHVQIAISAKSVVSAPKLKKEGRHKALPKAYWIELGMVTIKNENKANIKSKFAQFIASPKGKKILQDFGILF